MNSEHLALSSYLVSRLKALSVRVRALLSTLSILISIVALIVSFIGYRFQRDMGETRLVIDCLREMQLVQSELRTVRLKVKGTTNLQESEILLLNYYEILSRTFAENANPSLFTQARSTQSVYLRSKPQVSATQVGGIPRGESVSILGRFSYNSEDVWYYVLTHDRKLGWAYRHFDFPTP